MRQRIMYKATLSRSAVDLLLVCKMSLTLWFIFTAAECHSGLDTLLDVKGYWIEVRIVY
jgi:hypothetical protein